MKNTLCEERAASWWCLGFRWRDYPDNSHLSLYVNLPKTMCGCLSMIRVKVCYWNSFATGRLYLGCLCANVPEYSSAITSTFAVNRVIVVAISHTLSAIY